MSRRLLNVETLTAEAFAPFGDVIEMAEGADPLSINYGAALRFDDLARIDTAQEGGRTRVSLLRATPLPEPLRIRVMERHLLGSQAIIPLERAPFMVVVAPKGDFDPNAVRAFFAHGGQGVNYARGVWRHYCLALDAVTDFVVIDRAGPGNNLDEAQLKPDEVWRIES